MIKGAICIKYYYIVLKEALLAELFDQYLLQPLLPE